MTDSWSVYSSSWTRSGIWCGLLIASVFWVGTVCAQPPNILLVLADDQRSDTLDGMPTIQALATEGIAFQQAFVPTPLCGPSRSGLLTGRYVHHTGVLTNRPPHGGAPTFDASVTIATVLHEGGYATGYFGKYLNAYDQLSPAIPPGWDAWQVFVGDTDLYYGYRLNEDGVERDYGNAPEEYSTDVLRDRTAAFIQAHAATPWFAVYAPFTPHGGATPAPRHVGRYAGIPPWRPRSYGESDVTDKPLYWSGLQDLWSTSTTAMIDALRQHQLESLLAVDEAVAALMTTLSTTGVADHTVVIYTSDNGLGWGEHWMHRKRCGYDECLRVPLVIRDPQALPYREKRRLVLNLDLAPTIAELAGVTLPGADGQSLVPLLRSSRRSRHGVPWRSDFLTEGWNFPDEPTTTTQPPTYVGVRGGRWKYLRTDTPIGVVEEVYDLRRDRYELDGAIRTRREAIEAEAMRTRLIELQQ